MPHDYHIDAGTHLNHLIHSKKICFAENSELKIYGLLSCSSGKRMNINNHFFFESTEEAEHWGYRPVDIVCIKIHSMEIG